MAKTYARVVYGALAGSIASAVMTVIRMTARRHGLIEKTVPQAVEERLAARAGLGGGAHPALHHVVDHIMHVGYGAALGIAYGLRTRGRTRGVVARGLGYGVATWLFGSWGLLPLMKAKQAPSMANSALAAHARSSSTPSNVISLFTESHAGRFEPAAVRLGANPAAPRASSHWLTTVVAVTPKLRE